MQLMIGRMCGLHVWRREPPPRTVTWFTVIDSKSGKTIYFTDIIIQALTAAFVLRRL